MFIVTPYSTTSALPNPLEERRDIEAAVSDRSAFARIYERHVDLVYRHLVFRTGNRDLAEDLTSETFIRALRAIERFEWRGIQLRSWLLRIADSAAADYFRRRANTSNSGVIPEAPTESAEARMERELGAVALYQAIDHLSENQRLVVLLHLGHGLPHTQIAAILGRSDGAIRMLYSRAIRELRRELADD
jgi:RNA polymerase sigma-70 factor (ECF subfamily)